MDSNTVQLQGSRSLPQFARWLSVAEQEVMDISSAKWHWMADKDVANLETLFHDRANLQLPKSIKSRKAAGNYWT
jgi:hypothetical protein